MKRFLIIIGVALVVLVVAYAAGPRIELPTTSPPSPVVMTDPTKLDAEIARYERGYALKPDNEARIVWADAAKKEPTPYSIVYIHGYSASQGEGDPVHRNLAKTFGCNLYLTRTEGHGLTSPDAMKNMTPTAYLASAERALAIGKTLGKKVIVVGTSMGGMLTLYLASKHPEINGVVLYSPCIEVANASLKLITKPWGQQILDNTFPDQHVRSKRETPERAQYWYAQYHSDGLKVLQTVLDTYATPETFARVKQPVFMAYYYKDEQQQDSTVSVAAALKMFDELGTPTGLKRKRAFPEAGAHVIASRYTTKDWPNVEKATVDFMRDVLKLQPVAGLGPVVAVAPAKNN